MTRKHLALGRFVARPGKLPANRKPIIPFASSLAAARSLLAENQINDPAALRVRLLFAEVLRQLSVTRFEQGIVKGEGAVLASVERLGELHDGRGP